MGIGDFLKYIKEKVTQNAPDMTPVTNVYRDGTQKVTEYMPDSEGREKIKRIATEVGVPVILKSTGIPIPFIQALLQGHSIYNSEDIKKFEHQSKELKEIKEKYEKLSKEVKDVRHEIKILTERTKRLESQSKL